MVGMKKYFLILCVLFSFSAKGQTAFDIQVDSITYSYFPYIDRLTTTMDGGFATVGFLYLSSQRHPTVLKFDSIGNFQWGRYYIGTYTIINPLGLIQMPDSGYCLSFDFESDFTLNLNSWAVIRLDKNGQVVPNQGASDWAPMGSQSFINSISVEKNTGRIYIAGNQNFGDGYLLCYDSAFNLINRLFFNSPSSSGIGGPMPVYLNNGWDAIIFYGSFNNVPFTTKMDTLGNIVWQKKYQLASSGVSLAASDILQIDSFYYSVGFASKSYFRKTDIGGNTISCMIYDSVYVYRITRYNTSEFILLGSSLFGGLLINIDSSGNIIKVIKDSAYFFGNVDTLTKSVVALSFDTILDKYHINKTFINAGCHSSITTINSYAASVIDSAVSFPISTGGWNSPVLQFTDSALNVMVTNICFATTIKGVPQENKFSIFPNPATTQIKISSSLLEQKSTIELFDITGRRVLQHKTSSANQEITINVSAFQRGIYMVRISNEKGNVVRKVVLQ